MLRTWNSVLRCNTMTSQQIQYGARPPYCKSYFGYISTIYCSINAKLGTLAQSCSGTGQVTKLTIFENSRWRTAAILKIVSSLYLSRGSCDFNKIWCATADFGSKEGNMTKYQNFTNSKWRTAAIQKIVFGYICATYCLIAPCGLRGCKNWPALFLAGCRTRRLNQV